MRQFLPILAVIVLAGDAGFAQDSTAKNDGAGPSAAVVRAMNGFAIRLLKTTPPKENVFFSPISIHSSLRMLQAGARGRTESEIAHVLDSSVDSQRTENRSAMFNLQRSGQGYQLTTASSIWAQNGLGVDRSSEYGRAMQREFAAEIHTVDFAVPGDVLKQLNDWVNAKTAQRIPKLFSAALPVDTQLVVANAIYFKGNWEHPFDKKYTKDRDFYAGGQAAKPVPTMVLTESFRSWESAGLKAIELPYGNGQFSAVVLMPKARDGLAKLEKDLTEAQLLKIVAELGRPSKVTLFLPRFQFGTELDLKTNLQQMGIKNLFSSKADLSGIAAGPLSVSGIVHKAVIEVDEEGATAAASTGGFVGAGLPREFDVDHPFLFLIRETGSNAILFLGRIQNPLDRPEAR